MCQYFPKPYKSLEENINVKVDLSYYATKSDIKNILQVDKFCIKSKFSQFKNWS